MAHCLAERSHRRLLTDIIAGRCVSGATGNVLVPSEDGVSTGMIPRVRNVCHAYSRHRGTAAPHIAPVLPESQPFKFARRAAAIELLLYVANRNAAAPVALLKTQTCRPTLRHSPQVSRMSSISRRQVTKDVVSSTSIKPNSV